jgi:aminopeptidase-like protein
MITDYMELIEKIWSLNRVHVSDDTLMALRHTKELYQGSELLSYPTGARFGALGSWEIPPKWSVNHARLCTLSGRTVVDFNDYPLRLYSYSPSFEGTVKRAQLLQHITTDPDHPNAIPFHFRNQYRHWDCEWGFCLTQHELDNLTEDEYQVEISTQFSDSQLTQLEYVKKGHSEESYLLLGHFDHPAQCNDGLTGCIVANEVIRRLQGKDTYYTYRALNSIEIIGSVAYCDTQPIETILEALFIAAPGCDSDMAYQQSSQPNNSLIDQVVGHLFEYRNEPNICTPFRELWGNDEVAFETPGVDIRCGLLARHPLPGYHTSLDNFSSILPDKIEESIEFVLRIVDVVENNYQVKSKYRGLPCFSHPSIDLYIDFYNLNATKLSDEELFRDLTGEEVDYVRSHPQLCHNLMNQISPLLTDGDSHTLLNIAKRTKLPFFFVRNYLSRLAEKSLIEFSR